MMRKYEQIEKDKSQDIVVLECLQYNSNHLNADLYCSFGVFVVKHHHLNADWYAGFIIIDMDLPLIHDRKRSFTLVLN